MVPPDVRPENGVSETYSLGTVNARKPERLPNGR